MNSHSIFYYPYASFRNAQLSLLKVAARYFGKLYLLDPVGASWATIGTDYLVRKVAGRMTNTANNIWQDN